MQCESCGKNEANVHLTHVVNDVTREAHLCEGCAGKNGININGALSLTDILVGLGAIDETADSSGGEVCPFCRITMAELRRGARMGCAVCYSRLCRASGNAARDAWRKGGPSIAVMRLMSSFHCLVARSNSLNWDGLRAKPESVTVTPAALEDTSHHSNYLKEDIMNSP